MGKRLAVLVVAISVMLSGTALGYGRQIIDDGNDSPGRLDLKRVVFRYLDGKVMVQMKTYNDWEKRDIATVRRAGDLNLYIALDTSGDFNTDYYVGVYRENTRLIGIIREYDGGRIGDRVGQVPVKKIDRGVSFEFGGSRVGVQGDRIRWGAYTSDKGSCDCRDFVPNQRRWATYRF